MSLSQATPIRPAALRRAWPLALALLLIAFIATAFACTRHGRPALTSALLLPDMLVDLPVRPVTWLTPDPSIERMFIEYGDERILADIYRPSGGGSHPAVVFSMGAPPLDLDDSRLVKLGEDAARAGLVMIVPFSERLDNERIEPEEIDALVALFEFAEEQPYVEADRVGYIGVSVGGSLALVAAADPRIAERVDYVVAFGAYYSALDTLEAVGLRELAYDGLVETWDPDDHTVEVMAVLIVNELSSLDDRATLCKTFVDEWDWGLCNARISDRSPPDSSDLERLTPEGRAAFEFMAGGPSGRRALLAELPGAVAKLDAVSPEGTVDRLRAELFIIHDRGDEFIPYTESRRLRDALGERDGVHYTEVSLFEHVEPQLSRGGDVIVLDGARLYFRLYQLLLHLS